MYPGANRLVALVGPPNSGKTTLFNWMTGHNIKPVNYPGSTVEVFRGDTLSSLGPVFELLDTPGVHSLFPKSPEEEVTLHSLQNGFRNAPVQAVVLVLDATQLSRQIHLLKQVQDLGVPVLVALSMTDLLAKKGKSIDVVEFERVWQAPAVLVDGRLGGGVIDVIKNLPVLSEDPIAGVRRLALKNWTEEQWRQFKQESSGKLARITQSLPSSPGTPKRLDNIDHNSRETHLKGGETDNHQEGQNQTTSESLYRISNENFKGSNLSNPYALTRVGDQWLLSPWLGSVFFLLVMSFLFSGVFYFAAPLMDLLDFGVSQANDAVHVWLGEGILGSFIGDGLIASFGAVIVFLPQIFILFFIIGALEDSGYLARAAVLVDKPLSLVGLGGRSFVPLLSGFACAVPALMAARTIRSQRERWIAMFVLPLTSCSARLPVYGLLLSFVFLGEPAWKPGVSLAGIYMGSVLLSAIAASWLHRVLPSSKGATFALELPIYRWPNFLSLLRHSYFKTKTYLVRAGPLILLFSLLIWVFSSFPVTPGLSKSENFQQSYLAQFGRATEFLVEPMGLEWRTGLALISSFAAREVFVSTLAMLISVSNPNEISDEDSFRGEMLVRMGDLKKQTNDRTFSLASVVALILFFMISLQCLSTVITAYKESGSLRFALAQWGAYTVLAYCLAVLTFQFLHAASSY